MELAGAYNENLNIFDTILVDKSYTIGNFAKSFSGEEKHLENSSEELNKLIEDSANNLGIKLFKGNVICSEIFDYYVENVDDFIKSFPKDLNIIASEMESFALFYLANYFKKEASCLLTVVDSHYKNASISAEEREKSLNDMIKVALDTCLIK